MRIRFIISKIYNDKSRYYLTHYNMKWADDIYMAREFETYEEAEILLTTVIQEFGGTRFQIEKVFII